VSPRLCPGGTVRPALDPVDHWETFEALERTPLSSPLHDYLRNRIAAEKVPTADLARGAR
jgi:hypothetical protein